MSALTDQRLPKILCSAASGLTSFLSDVGSDPDAIFGQVAVDPMETNRPYSEITLAQFCALFETAALRTQIDSLGLLFGYGFAPRQLGVLGYAIVHTPTLRAGLTDLCRYFSAHQQATTLRLRTTVEHGYLEYKIRDARVGPCRQDAERSLAILQNIFRLALGSKWSPLEVHFEHSRRGELKHYHRVFPAPTYFNQGINSLTFHIKDLDALMPEPDPCLVGMLRPILEERALRPQYNCIAPIVQRTVEGLLASGSVEIEHVAGELSLSVAELRRALVMEGVRYRDLVVSARRELARRHLDEHDLPLTEIALSLGYSELSAFSRAFRDWTGVSPSAYRRCKQTQRPGTHDLGLLR